MAEQDRTTALDLKDYSLEELNEFHKIVMNGILNEQDPKVELSLSNSMWMDKSLQAKEVFKNNLKTYYNTSLYNVDFNKTDMANNEINNWANKETKGMIKDLQLPLTASTKFVLSNACKLPVGTIFKGVVGFIIADAVFILILCIFPNFTLLLQ